MTASIRFFVVVVAELVAVDLGAEASVTDLPGAEVLNLYPMPSSSSLSISFSAQSPAPPMHARGAVPPPPAAVHRACPSLHLCVPRAPFSLPSLLVRAPHRPRRPLPSSSVVTGGEGSPHRSKAGPWASGPRSWRRPRAPPPPLTPPNTSLPPSSTNSKVVFLV